MAKFWCPQCKETTIHSSPSQIKKGEVTIVCQKCGVRRDVDNIHTIYCNSCNFLTPQQIRKTGSSICLYCGTIKSLIEDTNARSTT